MPVTRELSLNDANHSQWQEHILFQLLSKD
jgi:hypothetical protein